MILVLAGTQEGQLAARLLEEAGYKVLASAATDYGGKLLQESIGGKVSSRPLDLARMEQIIAVERVTLLVDATHPFAEKVSANALRACRQRGIPYLRVERESSLKEWGEGVVRVGDLKEAAKEAKKCTGMIFLTTGSTHLKEYVSLLGADRLVVRVLPVLDSLQACLNLGVSPRNIIAMQGPFSVELNRAIFRQYRAAAVVTKDSGTAGGTGEKIRAAQDLGIPVIVIARPAPRYQPACSTAEEAVALVRKIVKEGGGIC